MPTNKALRCPHIYQLKITLLGTKPLIWRRLLTPADLSFAQLHDVLQVAMGWEDYHLHEFSIGGQRFGVPDPDDTLMGGIACVDERKVRLGDVLVGAGAKMGYNYDFGDDWEHSIVLEKVLEAEPGIVYPVCTGGKRRGPPEDCGGVYGYYNLLEALRDPEHEEHAGMLEWIGEGFDPDHFSIDDINRRLAPAPRRGVKKSKPL